jgi:hypothetical protein
MRLVSLGFVALFLTVAAGPAAASPLRVRNGSSVRVAVHGKREAGVGLRAQKGGWKLDFGASADEVADVIDVTDGANSARWTVEVAGGALFFDTDRFIPGHAYRVSVRKGTEAVGSALVYLYPPAAAAKSRVTFDDDAAKSGADGEDIAISKKQTL